eukprot:Gregarina_sp_Poly_1__1579@NODE_139_length_13109_cov_53_487809_g124_i0_p3_GENE_NODE_139_length_13109_cov_53_487809_g124_i0NODE_139_length_13109_cov_53_487809_g124_i0_p3_ORF_typecomplete_len335_score52_61GRASP55_65/PF04495_14/1_1e09GRASP55_65/PF04495_14/8_5e17GRASP55_65/PF04495_14/7_2e03PDZ_2/PF13180_6/0_0033PDZ_2/PF13180_6/1_1e07PDZ_6/PF17820_1/0_67PDZ_6/PF17820_1/4_6e07PDZ_6/PF17820_1/3_8e03PDZ/PF00595_24/1_6PDZ/PF00595_24/0_071Tricorn_PDZ/PF14685_6/17Tricorn_PDZ/PF14685_6/0_034PDZ_1/PF12812_7/6
MSVFSRWWSSAQSPSLAHGGFRVINVQPNSIAHKLKFEPYYDFIVSINDKVVSNDVSLGVQLCEAAKKGDMEISIYNAAKKNARRVTAECQGPIQLGATVKYMEFSCIYQEGLKILRVLDGTPAARAGLQAQTDWIIATADGKPVSHWTDLSKLIRQAATEDFPLGLIIYSSRSCSVREVCLTPDITPQGLPMLGAELGHGPDDRIIFPTPTVSVNNTPEMSPNSITENPHGIHVLKLESSEVSRADSESIWAQESNSEIQRVANSEAHLLLERFLKSVEDDSSIYDKLLNSPRDGKLRFQMSALFPSFLDCEEITAKGQPTKCISVPYFTVSN